MEFTGILNGKQIDTLSTVYIISLIPSLIGSLSVLVVSIVKRNHLQGQVCLLVQLSLADLLAALILMSTSVMNTFSYDKSVVICQYILPLALTFYFISFLLVVVYAWKSQNAIQGWRTQPADDEEEQSQCRRRIITLPVCAIVWLMPIALYLAYVCTPFIGLSSVSQSSNNLGSRININDGKFCTSCILFLHIWKDSCSEPEKIHDVVTNVFLFIVIIPVILLSSFIYYKVGKWYQRHKQEGLFAVEGDGRSRRRLKRMFSTARNRVIVILVCWIPALLLIILLTLTRMTNIQQYNLFGLYVLQALTVSLQGFLNSMVYAWMRRNFTEAVLGENTPLLSHQHVAFFEESLRSSSSP